jgi:hypothetical protein
MEDRTLKALRHVKMDDYIEVSVDVPHGDWRAANRSGRRSV